MSWNSIRWRITWILTRPRALARVWRRLGTGAALNLVRIRLGTRAKVYEIRVPRWPHPVYVRGGSSSDTFVLYEIFVTDEYAHVGDLGSPKFIIDGGANIGLVSVYFLNLYPTARIVAVEPDAETMELCRKNLAGYADRVTTFQGAIWSSAGKLSFQAGIQEWDNSVRSPREGESGSIEASTIPSLIALGGGGAVDLLKLDVEGAEREIFGPSAQDWLPSVKNIVIELHGPDCEGRFFSAMEPYEYEKSNRDNVCVCRDIRLRRLTT
jgi:FkbM family methyltransferase